MFKNTLAFFVLVVLGFSSCGSYEKVVYMQNSGKLALADSTGSGVVPGAVIKKGDVLLITINSSDPQAALPFNLPLIPVLTEKERSYSMNSGSSLSNGLGVQTYLVENDGYLNFPVIGRQYVLGLTKKELEDKLKAQIYPKYIREEPIVLIRFSNYYVSVLGEVAQPGQFYINNETTTLLEALAMAGDMTIFGERKNVLLVRDNSGKKESVRIDLTDPNLVNSPYFYLQQGDVVYVSPNGARARSSSIGSAESLTISLVGTLISLSTLIVSLVNR